MSIVLGVIGGGRGGPVSVGVPPPVTLNETPPPRARWTECREWTTGQGSRGFYLLRERGAILNRASTVRVFPSPFFEEEARLPVSYYGQVSYLFL
jgi:hypothetical protein